MIVYGEMLVAENTIIGAVLLYITGRICGVSDDVRFRKARLAAGSFMCGIFSLTIFLGIKTFTMLVTEMIFSVAVCTVTFGRRKKPEGVAFPRTLVAVMPWKNALTFILVTCFMGGVTMMLLLISGRQGIYAATGIYTGDMKAALLAVFICSGYAASMQIIRTVKRSRLYAEHSCSVRIMLCGRQLTANAFLDTGNHLREPVTGRPVAIASEAMWKRLQDSVSCEECGDEDIMQLRFALIPYEAVGISGVLEAIRIDSIETESGRIRGCYIAGSDGSFRAYSGRSAEVDRELLLSAEMYCLI